MTWLLNAANMEAGGRGRRTACNDEHVSFNRQLTVKFLIFISERSEQIFADSTQIEWKPPRIWLMLVAVKAVDYELTGHEK